MSLYVIAGECKENYSLYCAWKALTNDEQLYLAETRLNTFYDFMPILNICPISELMQMLNDRYNKKLQHISIFLASLDYEDELLKKFLETSIASDKMCADVFVCMSVAPESVVKTLSKVNVVQVSAEKQRVLTSRSFQYVHRKTQNDEIYRTLLQRKKEKE